MDFHLATLQGDFYLFSSEDGRTCVSRRSHTGLWKRCQKFLSAPALQWPSLHNEAIITMDPVLKKVFFELSATSPGEWYFQAHQLKTAADRLDYVKQPVRDDEYVLSHGGAYQMLLSFSFENLLKGLIIFFRMMSGEDEPLQSKHFTHNLKSLATEELLAPLALTPSEIKTLDRLSAYGIWAGRYPMPKKEQEVIVQHYGGHFYAAEHALWNRIATFLGERAWITKWGGDQDNKILMLVTPDANRPDYVSELPHEPPRLAEGLNAPEAEDK